MNKCMLTIMLTLFCGVSMMSQEWEFFMDTYADSPYYRKFTDAIELQDGSIVVNSTFELPIEGHYPVPHQCGLFRGCPRFRSDHWRAGLYRYQWVPRQGHCPRHGSGYVRRYLLPRACRRYRCRYHRGGISGYNLRPKAYTASDLESMTIAEIKALAGDLGYTLTETKKADIIEEFLAQQG